MSSPGATDRLRLIHAYERAPMSVSTIGITAPRRRRTDTKPAAGTPTLSATDARWVLASRVQDSLEGGRAGVLRPESRSRMIELGRRLGLRPFDINLIIAIVQDHARCAASEPRAEMLNRLALVPGSHSLVERLTPEHGRAWWAAWCGGAAVLAAVVFFIGITWLRG